MKTKILLWFTYLMTIEATSFAARMQPKSIEELAKEANLIFEGKVTKVEYKSSLPDQQQPSGIPHTFVTYKVLSQIKGKAPAQFTLKLLGGLNAQGIASEVAHFPTFDIGDHDVLLVKGNSAYGCPLVSCDQGRFRIEQGKVYTDEARAVVKGPNQNIGLGGVYPLASAASHNYVHPTTNKVVTVTTKGSKEDVPPVDPNQFSLPSFVQFLLKETQNQPILAQEATAEITKPIPALNLMPSRAIELPDPSVIQPRDQQEKVEWEKLKANDGNPVIQ